MCVPRVGQPHGENYDQMFMSKIVKTSCGQLMLNYRPQREDGTYMCFCCNSGDVENVEQFLSPRSIPAEMRQEWFDSNRL